MGKRLRLLAISIAIFAGCTEQTGTSTSSSSSSGGGGEGGSGGSGNSCADILCSQPGEVCMNGACVVDCRRAGSQPCASGRVCNVAGMQPGQCVDPAGSCITASNPEPCGAKVCGSGSACDGNGHCYPLVPCSDVSCDADGCWGTSCSCVREKPCTPAPLGMPGETGTLHDNAFRKGLVDLEFDPTCGAWGATLISGPDFLREIAPDGTVTSHPSITNLNMGEVSVLQQITIPKFAPTSTGQTEKPTGPKSGAADLEVAATYICCAGCGCQLDSVPQGAIRFDPLTNTLPLVIPSQTVTTGTGPFGGTVIDTGPAGLSYGMDRVLYVGNIDANGDYYRVDLGTQQKSLVTTFASRVYAATPFDAVTMLVALEGGELRLLRIVDGSSTLWATSDQPVTGLVRDFFDGSVYLSRRDGSILRFSSAGVAEPFQTVNGASRISIALDGFLYALEIPAPFADHLPTVVRFSLPDTR
ncbi:MAG TPA: hypothetical protein PK156_13245 [Polyangium sp.]|nr:hypothetical protein [Polyangium sp.]